jgi:hypothetical protein
MSAFRRSLIALSVVGLAEVMWRRSKARATTRRLLTRIQGEYKEMPGHALTVRQAARLWQLPPSRCQTLLQILVDENILQVMRGNRYILRSS